MPVTKIWAEWDRMPPIYYLNNNSRCYYYSMTDVIVAEEIKKLPSKQRKRFYPITTVADSSLKAQDSAISSGSPTWTTDGIYGSALEFDGVDDEVDTDASIDPPATGAVSFWMRGSGTPTVRERPFGVNGNWEARLETTGLLKFDIGASPAAGTEPFSTTTAVDEDGRWYHIVAMFNADTDLFEVYVNGELEASGTSPVDLVAQSEGILSFGTRTGSTENWNGALDEFRVYNRWLSVSEVNDLYGRLAYWKLDETSGTNAVDSTEHGNDGSYTGGPTLGLNGAYVANTATAIELDGLAEYVDINKTLVNDLSAFTMFGWVRADSVDSVQSLFGQNDVIEFGINYTSGQLHLNTANGGSIDTFNRLPVGKWTHVAVTGDGTELKIYVNGLEYDTGGSATASYGSNTDNFMLGAGVYSGSGDYLDGRLDDVQVFDRALKVEEIFGFYKRGRPAGVRIINWLEVR